MTMAIISLTWEIERGPDCAQKQVIMHYYRFPDIIISVQQSAYWKSHVYTLF